MKILKDEKENFTMKTNKYSGTKTEQNLRTAFSGVTPVMKPARTRYSTVSIARYGLIAEAP